MKTGLYELTIDNSVSEWSNNLSELQQKAWEFNDNIKNLEWYVIDTVHIYSDKVWTNKGAFELSNNECNFDTILAKLVKMESKYTKQVQRQSVYYNFVNEFKNLIKKELSGCNIYPTSYGFGIWVWSKAKQHEIICKTLNRLNIDYKTEWSEGGYVYRYKISKAAANISKL